MMKRKTLAAMSISVMVACSSADSLAPRRIIQGKATGQPIVVEVTGLDSQVGLQGELQMELELTVTNVADYPVTVINVLPELSELRGQPGVFDEPFQISPVSSGPLDRKLESGEETSVRMNVEGGFTRRVGSRERRTIPFRVQVSLSNNETYLYSFSIPIRNT